MALECPNCQESQVEVLGFTESAKTELRCALCDHAWLYHREPATPPRPVPLTYQQAHAAFPKAEDVTAEVRSRVASLKAEFLTKEPEPDPQAAAHWTRYQGVFSDAGLVSAPPDELKSFANTSTGAGIGNMSVFNRAWNEAGDEAAAEQLRGVLTYLLRGPADLALEDRLTKLIDPEDPAGMTGFRESLLTKVLCVMEPTRFLPILIYTSPKGGKREIARNVFGLELPAPEATSWTRGRLACWSNDLLVELVGDGFADLQHASQFLWWAKDLNAPATASEMGI